MFAIKTSEEEVQKRFAELHESCGVLTSLGEGEICLKQILSSAQVRAFLGCGFGYDERYVAVGDDPSTNQAIFRFSCSLSAVRVLIMSPRGTVE